MKQYTVTGMSCAACSSRVEKAVSKVPGVTACSVSLLTNSMGVEGDVPPETVIHAVEDAGYGASLKGQGTAAQAQSASEAEDALKDRETPVLKHRLIASLGFLAVLMYMSMGHMMWGWPLPHFMDGNHVAMGLLQLLLAGIIMVINQKFFISGFKGLLHRAPNMDTLVALGSGASFIYSTYALFAMTDAQLKGNDTAVMSYMHEFYFESAAMILALITVGKMLEARSKGKTTDALKGLMKLAPKTAVIIRDGVETKVPIEEVKKGNVFVVRPGENIPVDGVVLKEGDFISLNGSTGEVYKGKVETKAAELSGDFAELMQLADKYTRLQVRTNADTPHDAQVARNFGAVGIGLCRTEHMFFEGEKIKAMREMILAEDAEGRRKALAKILPYQQADFKGIFKAMEGCPVTVRLLDPPLHEFVPHDLKGQQEMADTMGVSLQYIQQRVEALCEHNPMLGHRGCRLGNTYPEITQMQTRAILGAALELKKEGVETHPEIMVPLTGILYEFKQQEEVIRAEAAKLFAEVGDSIEFKVGTMIEIPRAALTADRIASSAEFFSFGTNDLTQMTFGYSRDDIASFLPIYLEKKILKVDPFQVLDQNGVGQLVRMATEKGRAIRPDLKCGICGEHGGEPSSVKFCHKVGLNYVSCSPFRVPIARLAAAQAAIEG